MIFKVPAKVFEKPELPETELTRRLKQALEADRKRMRERLKRREQER